MHVFSSAYNEYTVISKEYIDPFDFDITGVDCSCERIREATYTTQFKGLSDQIVVCEYYY